MVQSINPMLERITKIAIKDASNGVYRVEFQDFKFNLAGSTLIINGFKLIPDSARYYHLLEQDSIGPDLFELYVPELRVRRINLIEAFSGKSLKINEIILNSPVVEVLHHPRTERDSTESFDLNNLFEDKFKSLQVKEIRLKDLKLNYQVIKEDAPPPFIVNNINFRMFNLDIDSASYNDPNKLLYTDDFEFKVSDYTYKLADSLYILKIKELGLSQSKGKIYFDSLEMIPRYQEIKFSKIVGVQTNRIVLKTKRIELDHIDMGALLNFQNLIAGSMFIENTKIDVFRDKRYPENLKRRPKMLHQILKNLDFYLKIDTIKLLKADIVYREHGEESTEVGHLAFNNFYASIYGLTNDSLLIKNDKIIADLQAQIYGSNLLKAKLTFDIGHPNGRYDFTGVLSSMDLRQFNNFLLPSAHINIENGKLHEATFSVVANDDVAVGKMYFKYDDLKIKVLDKDGENGLKQKITSFVANTFVVKKSNPGGGSLREGNINYTRDKSKSKIHFLGRILLTGVASSVGISEKAMTKSEADSVEKRENKRSRKS
ncbi:MAG: hypothetical protein M3421_09680 [Bacteroidota bacterium]|nr:hypothetical protein [Bacteroidota bacterium]